MKIAVLVSGGVDSSVALRLLEEQDHDIAAFYLKIWLDENLSHLTSCPWEEDLNYIKQICKEINVPFEILSMQKAYYERVVEFTISEIKSGRTPNPDVWCNNRIKFGLFSEQITGFDRIASGHYARLSTFGNYPILKMAPDPIKDQTYFLAHLPRNRLNGLLFPIGDLTKQEVRQLATDYGLPNAKRKDSQGICFLGKFKYRDFVKHFCGTKRGHFVEFETGKKVGQHLGYWFYTRGQRKGMGLSGGPWYIVDKDPDTNVVYVSKTYQSLVSLRKSFIVDSLNWFLNPEEGETLKVKLRHGPKTNSCVLTKISDQSIAVELSEPDQGLAAGQFAVFYRDDICLGSGIIT